MFNSFFDNLRNNGVPVSLLEFLSFLACLEKGVTEFKIENFYFLAKTSLIKHEKHLDIFDKVFAKSFNGIENLAKYRGNQVGLEFAEAFEIIRKIER